jgi:hypothetical protein
MPQQVQDIIRASSFLVFLTVAAIWCSGNLAEIYSDLIDSITPPEIIVPELTKLFASILYDIVCHVLPFFILGLPQYASSIVIAYGIILAWYGFLHRYLSLIYTPHASFDLAMILVGIVGLGTALWLK